jgi:hypothetical protein
VDTPSAAASLGTPVGPLDFETCMRLYATPPADPVGVATLAACKAAQAASEDIILAVTVGCTALGGVMLLALLMRDWRSYALSAFFGLLTGVLMEPVLARWTEAETLVQRAGPVLLCVAAAVLARLIAEMFLEEKFAELRTGASKTLVPENWSEPAGLDPVTTRDRVRRWFVTISAATGAAVGGLFGIGQFWTTLGHTFEPRSLVFGVMLVVVSLFLGGPIQGYIFDIGGRAQHVSDPSKKLSDLFSDSRAVGRFVIVLVAYLQVYLLTSCVGATIKQGDSRVIYTVFATATVPAIVSYYWAAALQRRAPSVTDATVLPSLYVGATMSYGIALMVVGRFAYDEFEAAAFGGNGDQRAAGFFLFFSPVAAIIPAVALGALTTLAYSFLGGLAIDRYRGRHAMVAIAAALVVAAILQLGITTGIAYLLGYGPERLRFLTFACGIVGWLVGLWASGFPRLLTDDRPKPVPVEAVSDQPSAPQPH